MADPEVALDTLAREELGLNPGDLGSPWRAAVSSFLALAAGAVVPLLPFLCAAGSLALAASADVSALALAGVGEAISIFTSRHWFAWPGAALAAVLLECRSGR